MSLEYEHSMTSVVYLGNEDHQVLGRNQNIPLAWFFTTLLQARFLSSLSAICKRIYKEAPRSLDGQFRALRQLRLLPRL